MRFSVRDPALELIEQRIFERTYGRQQLILDPERNRPTRSVFRKLFIEPIQNLFINLCECLNFDTQNSVLSKICRSCCRNCFGELAFVLLVVAIVIILVALGKELASIIINWIKSWLPSLNILSILKGLSNVFVPFY